MNANEVVAQLLKRNKLSKRKLKQLSELEQTALLDLIGKLAFSAYLEDYSALTAYRFMLIGWLLISAERLGLSGGELLALSATSKLAVTKKPMLPCITDWCQDLLTLFNMTLNSLNEQQRCEEWITNLIRSIISSDASFSNSFEQQLETTFIIHTNNLCN